MARGRRAIVEPCQPSFRRKPESVTEIAKHGSHCSIAPLTSTRPGMMNKEVKMESENDALDYVHLPDVTFRFPDGHAWRYAGCERVWMHEDPMGAEWADCEACIKLMDKIGEPPLDEIPLVPAPEAK